jgi:hypothetical protein
MRSKLSILLAWSAAVACCVGSLRSQVLYDLRAQWSEISNPNGVWTLREGGNALPHQSTIVLDTWTTPQPGWVPGISGVNRAPAWFQSNGTETSPYDWQAGDIVVHTTDSFAGAGKGPANVIWTSPAAGSIDISGFAWMGRDIGRSNDWSIALNGVTLTSGSLASGDAYDRAHPFVFTTGASGASVLQNIIVAAGDVVQLELVNTSGFGDYVAVSFSVSLTAIPEPPTAAALAGLLTLAFARWRKTRSRFA